MEWTYSTAAGNLTDSGEFSTDPVGNAVETLVARGGSRKTDQVWLVRSLEPL